MRCARMLSLNVLMGDVSLSHRHRPLHASSGFVRRHPGTRQRLDRSGLLRGISCCDFAQFTSSDVNTHCDYGRKAQGIQYSVTSSGVSQCLQPRSAGHLIGGDLEVQCKT